MAESTSSQFDLQMHVDVNKNTSDFDSSLGNDLMNFTVSSSENDVGNSTLNPTYSLELDFKIAHIGEQNANTELSVDAIQDYDQASLNGLHDTENMPVSENLVSVMDMSQGLNAEISQDSVFQPTEEVQFNEDEFHDAVQFFKDPSAFEFLKSVGNKSKVDSVIARCSLYKNFDPLHKVDDTPAISSLPITEEALEEKENESEEVETNLTTTPEQKSVDVINQHLNNVKTRESVGNILISFESPVKLATEQKDMVAPKAYTEEELQQALKMQELTQSEILLRKQQENEKQVMQLNHACQAWKEILEEVCVLCLPLIDEKKQLELANEKLKSDVQAAVNDLQSVEAAFADFHKRYEHCKLILKNYKDNEEIMKSELMSLQSKLEEQEKSYEILKQQAQEEINRANSETANVQKISEAQIAVMKVQLQKAELTISRLENDMEQVQIENNKLGGLCDDLISQVGNAN